jgi:hypothetical protein
LLWARKRVKLPTPTDKEEFDANQQRDRESCVREFRSG